MLKSNNTNPTINIAPTDNKLTSTRFSAVATMSCHVLIGDTCIRLSAPSFLSPVKPSLILKIPKERIEKPIKLASV